MITEQELDQAKARWQAGHHLFFSLVQGLILAFNKFEKHIQRDEMELAKHELERITQILWGVSATFKLTGDFGDEAYDKYVRQEMFGYAEGFSGLWSHDHDYLVKTVLRRLKLFFKAPPAELKPAMAKFQQAFAVMYDSHKYVCEKFEGDAPSLLMGKNSQKSAAEMIDLFKHNRMMVLGIRK
ncbi:MAG: hypothetical protein AAF490_32380 [Chloroflexota bacterium]